MRPVPFSALPLLTSLLLATAAAHAEWEALPPLPASNGGCLAGVEEGRILVVGGTNWQGGVKNWLNTVHAFDPATKQWITLKGALKTPVAYGLDVQRGAHLGFIGGSDGKTALKIGGSMDGDVVKLDAVPALPATVVLAAGGMVGEQFFLVGGMDDAANLAGVTRAAYLIEGGEVRRVADYPGKPFAVAASAVVGHEVLIFGGMNYDATTQLPLGTTSAYTFSTAKKEDAWRPLKPLPKPTRGLAAVVLDEQHVYLAGGYVEDFTADAVIYDVKSDTYTPAPPLPYAAMVKLVRCDDFIYCLGGEDKKQSRTDKCFRVKADELLR